MAFVYRYINIQEKSIVYIGRTFGDANDCPITKRHKQHKHAKWYKESLILQYSKVGSLADADILETILIYQCDSPQLANKQKRWGKPMFQIDPSTICWTTWLCDGCEQEKFDIHEKIRTAVNIQLDWLEFKNAKTSDVAKRINDILVTEMEEYERRKKYKGFCLEGEHFNS